MFVDSNPLVGDAVEKFLSRCISQRMTRRYYGHILFHICKVWQHSKFRVLIYFVMFSSTQQIQCLNYTRYYIDKEQRSITLCSGGAKSIAQLVAAKEIMFVLQQLKRMETKVQQIVVIRVNSCLRMLTHQAQADIWIVARSL